MNLKIVVNKCYGGFSLSKTACKWLKDRGFDTELIYPIPRDLPLLIECVETLGSEVASGECAELEVVELKVSWEIENYDGIENVRGLVLEVYK